jgi:hypothetical protein
MLGRDGRLPNPCPIKVKITDTDVFLYVGPRDWQWNRATGKLVGCGTVIDPPSAEGGMPILEGGVA